MILALPTIKNAVLFVQYEHGHTTMERIGGKPGQLTGIWKGTFDTYLCGMDERHEYRFTFYSDLRGRLEYRHLYDRIGGSGANIYDWRALLPFDENRATTYVANVIVEDDILLIIPNDTFFTPDTLIAAYTIEEEHMHFAYVNNRREIPENWGVTNEHVGPKLIDLWATWW